MNKCTITGTFLGQAVEVKVVYGTGGDTGTLTSLVKASCNGSAHKVSAGYPIGIGCDNVSGSAHSALAVSDGKVFAVAASTLKSDLAVNADIRKIATDNNKRAATGVLAAL